MTPRAVWPLVFGFAVACRGAAETSRGVPGESAASVASGLDSLQGLGGDERQTLHHLGVGSEIVPLAWAKALVGVRTGKPFLEDPERFGAIADHRDADGLPVGFTSEVTRDDRAVSRQRMLGITCAACHVRQIVGGGDSILVEGAPGGVDIDAFEEDLERSLDTLTKDVSAFKSFLSRLRGKGNAPNPMLDARRSAASVTAHRQLPDLTALAGGTPFERRVDAAIDALLLAERRKPVPPLGEGLTVGSDTALHEGAWRRVVFVGRRPDDVRVAGLIGPEAESELAKVTPPGDWVARLVPALLSDVAVTHFQIVRFRNELAARRSGRTATLGAAYTGPHAAGPGRVDAFRTTRRFLHPGSDLALDAPVRPPSLWGYAQKQWYDWDGSTNAVVERNMEQALFAGGVVDPVTQASTLDPAALQRLDGLVRRIRSPKWPGRLFGTVDRGKAEQGRAIFATQCASCHAYARDAGAAAVVPAPAVGTDPNRARGTQVTLGTRSYPESVAVFLSRLRERAYADSRIPENRQRSANVGRPPGVWRATGGYVAPALDGVWASAPYLHNGSVPTLADLLLPPSARPATFAAGTRTYDPVRVGLARATGGRGAGPVFDTRRRGNGNVGHEYGTRMRSEERAALLEFLKTL